MDAPERIWLLPHDGEQRCWCDDPAPGLDMDPGEADEYVRADLLAAKDAEIERLRAVVQEVHDDCILRARTDRNGDKIVPIGRSVWIGVCAALEDSHE